MLASANREPLEHVCALTRLAKIMNRAPRDHLAPVGAQRLENLLQRQNLRLPILQRHHC